ncbi:MAG: 4-hydroxy-3-methylbut-2-enyl diphosphate reductase [Synergistaceae bacterium]|jgi:4-hydroxy-3-methylbut-2-enyl diphosphate reductase|nr:4-hydroxy-3-methylbut-2-enyl diphosphate reductase [Synergistaceae bacterium]
MEIREIIVAEHAGFCFGVKRAVDGITAALEGAEGRPVGDRPSVWSIGMPIHNQGEVARLCGMGLHIADDADGVPDGARVFIRAHGESLAVIQALRDRGAEVSDMTCPFVRRAQDYAAEFSSPSVGYHVVLLGDVRHPEIRSIIGHVEDDEARGRIDVVSGVEDALNLPDDSVARRVALISQTTQREGLLAAVASALVLRTKELHVCNTICRATVDRQNAVRRLAGRVDGLVVIGGRESANTAKLSDIGAEAGMDVLRIEDVGELDWGWLSGKHRIGIAAGASTPQGLITELRNKIARS